MQTAREKAINVIKKMPKDTSLEAIIEQLRFMDKINKGIEDLEKGNVINHEESKLVLAEWLE